MCRTLQPRLLGEVERGKNADGDGREPRGVEDLPDKPEREPPPPTKQLVDDSLLATIAVSSFPVHSSYSHQRCIWPRFIPFGTTIWVHVYCRHRDSATAQNLKPSGQSGGSSPRAPPRSSTLYLLLHKIMSTPLYAPWYVRAQRVPVPVLARAMNCAPKHLAMLELPMVMCALL